MILEILNSRNLNLLYFEMSSIIESYTYDIFISYRQKDNKHDGRVTKFVDNQKGELNTIIH
jgi:hypothetical protein